MSDLKINITELLVGKTVQNSLSTIPYFDQFLWKSKNTGKQSYDSWHHTNIKQHMSIYN